MNVAAPTQPRMSNAGANVGRNVFSSPAKANTNIGFSSASAASNSGSSATSGIGAFLKGWGGILLIVVILIVVFALYYQTIGYYIQIGWEKLGWSRKHGERIQIDTPGGGLSADLTPATGGNAGSSIEASLGGAVKKLEADVETALGPAVGPGKKQVFNISRNIYTYGEAEPLCRAFGAELATYDQVKEAYEAGADWCNYGWVKGQQAVYPTQKDTWTKLQHGPESERLSCGMPGMNGGYFPNADQRFGVNCYGARPAESALDERVAAEDRENIAFDREVNHFKAELGSIAVTPWSAKQWSS
jgi:hypothetical protein